VSRTPDAPGFAPEDRTDRRPLRDWRTRYPEPEARRSILIEALYLGAHIVGIPVLLLLVWAEYPADWLNLPPERYPTLARFLYAWLGGMLGGTLFCMKWLYHSVAKEIWNQDRRLWRLFTPHLSAGLSFAFIALAASDLIPIIDVRRISSPTASLGMAFLVGYFSDNATAALARIANRVFGEHPNPDTDRPPPQSDDDLSTQHPDESIPRPRNET
jgi:hypothetical protein